MIISSIIVGLLAGLLVVLAYEDYTKSEEYFVNKTIVFWLGFTFGLISTYVILYITK